MVSRVGCLVLAKEELELSLIELIYTFVMKRTVVSNSQFS